MKLNLEIAKALKIDLTKVNTKEKLQDDKKAQLAKEAQKALVKPKDLSQSHRGVPQVS